MKSISPKRVSKTERYGPLADQIGDLYLPRGAPPPVVCLIHGGFWRMPYKRDQMAAIAADLVARGYAVWNLEYRRLGRTTGGWPGPFEDVISAIEHLSSMTEGIELDLSRLAVIGHSAGGQLALLSATSDRESRSNNARRNIHIAAVVGQAPIPDLIEAQRLGIGGGAIDELLGGSPSECYPYYLQASPIAQLPLGIPQLILHGTSDDVVPVEISRTYIQAAKAAGDPVELIELPGGGHMDFLDPSSAAHAALCRWLTRLF